MKKQAMKKNVLKKDIPNDTSRAVPVSSNIDADVSREEDYSSNPRRPKSRSRRKRKKEIQIETEERRKQYEAALSDLQSNPGMSFYACSKKHKVDNKTLTKLYNTGRALYFVFKIDIFP